MSLTQYPPIQFSVIRAAEREPNVREVWHHKENTNTNLAVRARISRHYAWALTKAFARPNITHVMIFEDDLTLAPDAIEYLYAASSFLTSVKRGSVVAASAWNDNGRAAKVPMEATLTSFFPGLGWVLSRVLWQRLAPQWPASVSAENPAPVVTGWDYWLRIQFLMNDWQTIVPTTPRTRHASIGANVNHEQNTNLYSSATLSDTLSRTLNWRAIASDLTDTLAFEAKIQQSLSTGRVITMIEDAIRLEESGHILVMPYYREDYLGIASRLSLWPTPRGHFHHTLLATVPNSSITILMYDQIRASAFFALPNSQQPHADPSPKVALFVADLNKSCDVTCEEKSLICTPLALERANECETLLSLFGPNMCKGCAFETGADLPAAVDIGAPIETARLCLVTEMGQSFNGTLDCAGRFRWTRRACGCVTRHHKPVLHDEL